MKHFLKETDFNLSEAAEIFALARQFKKLRKSHSPATLQRQSWGLLFYKKSTRTRVSFQVGVNELGGFPLILNSDELQLSRGETPADTARVLSRYLHGLVIRAYEHSLVEEFARVSTIPIVNALTDFLHPCQIYSDIFSMAERWATGDNLLESVKGKKLAFLGDTACNMANSFILGGAMFGIDIHLAGPAAFQPGAEIRDLLKAENLPSTFSFHTDPYEAVKNADVVYTDVWVSMGAEADETNRLREMRPYAVTAELMRAAKPDALFMHCLPAHPGYEVTQDVIDSPQSIIFDQAENRLHMQKAILSALAKNQ